MEDLHLWKQASRPPAPNTGDGYEKKYKVALGFAIVLGLAAIGLGIWGYSTKSDLDDANAKAAEIESKDTNSLDDVQAQYEKVKSALSSRDVEVDDLEAEIKKQSAELEDAKTATANAESDEEREQAQAEQTQKQLQARDDLRAGRRRCDRQVDRRAGRRYRHLRDDRQVDEPQGRVLRRSFGLELAEHGRERWPGV